MGRARQPSEVTCAAPNYLPVRQITTLLVPQSHSRQDLMTCLKFLTTNEQKESSNCKCLPFLHCLSCLAEYKKTTWRRLMVDCTLLLLVM